MVQSKSELFEKSLSEQANLFKALSHPARLQILKFIAEAKSCITGDISDELPLSRTTVNQHIKELKAVGLIQGEIEGVKTKYCLNVSKIEELKRSSLDFFDALNTETYTCK
ncbi:ArsR/SmtB family transcription factor [Labilibacter marinus]|uniref:ArsR/SmtB family transcription factor n=1 Tax=Labilibacter marinus TaxID=1477105 RepID=UPI00094FFC23|nr:metalloregulator ArsR/SmtB family transcription factor [Labilibacter marinus]